MKQGLVSSPMCPAKGMYFSNVQTQGLWPSCMISEPHLNVCFFLIPVLSLNPRCSVVFSQCCLLFFLVFTARVIPPPPPQTIFISSIPEALSHSTPKIRYFC